MSQHHHDENTPPYCLNCHYPMGDLDKFCPQCGQKSTTGRVSIHDLVHELTHSVFHVDGKLFSTLKYLFQPGKLTVEFFRGHHKRYAHPVQMFIVLGALCFGAITFAIHTFQDQAEKGKKKTTYDFWGTEKDYELRDELDSIKKVIADRYQHPSVELAMASVDSALSINADNDSATLNITNMGDYKDTIRIKKRDLAMMDPDELVEHYKVEGWIRQKVIKQGQKSLGDKGRNMTEGLLSRLFWMCVFLLPLFGSVLVLLYVRRRPKYYFVEHLVFLIHVSCFAFLSIGTMMLVTSKFSNQNQIGIAYLILAIAIAVYGTIALRVFYRQNWFKTILKALILGFSFMIIIFLGLSVTTLVAFFMA